MFTNSWSTFGRGQSCKRILCFQTLNDFLWLIRKQALVYKAFYLYQELMDRGKLTADRNYLITVNHESFSPGSGRCCVRRNLLGTSCIISALERLEMLQIFLPINIFISWEKWLCFLCRLILQDSANLHLKKFLVN